MELRVFAIQTRLYKASLLGLRSLIFFVQNILILSLEAKLLVARIIINEIQCGYYPDFISKFCRLSKIFSSIKNLKINGRASFIQRVFMPKHMKLGLRLIFIPTIMDRVAHLLVHRALEPI